MPTLSYEEYLPWHQQQLGDDLNSADLALRYQANVTLLKSSVEAHQFMAALSVRLARLVKDGLFQDSHRAPELSLNRKPYPSYLNKLYRLNCLWNKRWPEPPHVGWINYAAGYERVDDLVRTTLICKYLDAPEIVAGEIVAAAEENGLKAFCAAKATDSGYYGWHAYVTIPQNLLIGDASVEVKSITEFQITTQLQAVLRELTHKFYERSRAAPTIGRTKSKWDYRSDSFRAEYLGHTLHLVDAMILELRDAEAPENETINPPDHAQETAK